MTYPQAIVIIGTLLTVALTILRIMAMRLSDKTKPDKRDETMFKREKDYERLHKIEIQLTQLAAVYEENKERFKRLEKQMEQMAEDIKQLISGKNNG